MRAHLVLASLCAMLLPTTLRALDCLHYEEMAHWATIGPLPEQWVDAEAIGTTLCLVGREMNEMGGWMSLLDVSNPNAPVNAGFMSFTGNGKDVTLMGDYALVSAVFSYHVSVDFVYFYFYAIDISNPAFPEVTSTTTLGDGSVTESILYGPYLLTVAEPHEYNGTFYGGNQLCILNVHSPLAPFHVSSVPIAPGPSDIETLGNYAYVADSLGLSVYDLSNISAPALVTTVPIFGGLRCIERMDLRLVAASDAEMIVYDLANAEDPVAISSEPLPSIARDLALRDDRVYAVCDAGVMLASVDGSGQPDYLGTVRCDPSDPGRKFTTFGSQPVTLRMSSYGLLEGDAPPADSCPAYCPIAGSPESVALLGDFALVANGTSGLEVCDISDLDLAHQVEHMNTPGHASAVRVAQETAVLADGMGGLQTYGIDEAGQLTYWDYLGTSDFARDVEVQNGLAYVANSGAGLLVASISDPHAVTAIGTMAVPGSAVALAIQDTLLFIVDSEHGLCVATLSMPAAPTIVASLALEGGATDVELLGATVYVTSNGKLISIDAADIGALAVIAQVQLPTDGTSIGLKDGIAYVACGDAGVALVDISNSASLALLGMLCYGDSARGIALADAFAVVADARGLTFTPLQCDLQLTPVEPGGLPASQIRALTCYPNPFNPSTTVHFTLDRAAAVDVRIVDISGRLVRTLTTGQVFPAGEVRLSWDGRDESGVRLSSGVYLYSIEGIGTQATGKMTLLK